MWENLKATVGNSTEKKKTLKKQKQHEIIKPDSEMATADCMMVSSNFQ